MGSFFHYLALTEIGVDKYSVIVSVCYVAIAFPAMHEEITVAFLLMAVFLVKYFIIIFSMGAFFDNLTSAETLCD